MQAPALSPQPYFGLQNLWHHRFLIYKLVQREISSRYRASLLGLLWSLVTPVLLLLVYTFIFSTVFKLRWGGAEEDSINFALVLFVGMIVHGFFADVINRSPTLVLANVNYVKKVVFPLEVLSTVAVGSALFQTLVQSTVLMVALLITGTELHLSVLLLPIVMLPLVLLTLGICLFFSSVGVYLRDLSQLVGIITMVMLFMSPVFYPISAVPEHFQTVILMNPLTFIIEQARAVVLYGESIHWFGLAVYFAISLVVYGIGHWWFEKTRRGFADVL